MTTSRIVFSFQKLLFPDRAQPMTTLSVKEPEGHEYTSNLFDLNGIGTHAEQGVNAWNNATVGGQLFNALYTGESVRKVLDARSTLVGSGRPLPMYFDLTAVDELNDIPWETLWTQDDKFLALSNWPIGRMLQSYAGKVISRELQPPFRIAAVLSSLGVNPNSEWHSLKAAVEASHAEVQVLLLLSDTTLHDSLQTNRPDWLTVGLVPMEYVDLQTTITDFRPHVVHLFCHGSTAGGPHLEIATVNDVLQQAATSRHRLEAQQIRELVRHSYEAPWAIVLNACSSAQTNVESGARSLAASLVRDLGIQAVIGMRKPVLDRDAACFSRNFYQSLLDQIQLVMSKGGRIRELDWATFTVEARQRLLQDRGDTPDAAASASQEWTLPVVVVRPDPFRFKTTKQAATAASDKAQFKALYWAQLVANMPPDAPKDMPQQPPEDDTPEADDIPRGLGTDVQPGSTRTDVPDFDTLQVVKCDAWTGSVAASAPLSPLRDSWALSKAVLPAGTALLPAPDADEKDWRDPRIGWGVVLPDADGYNTEQLSTGADAPEPIRALLASRPGSKVLRYRNDSIGFNTLRDYASGSDIPIGTAPVGAGPGAIPDYLLIVGSPGAIPWTVQYKLNLVRKVGRLDLDPDGLSNYVNALINGWQDCTTDFTSPLIWAVNHGGDITPLMRDAVAAPLYEAYHQDSDLSGTRFIDGTNVHATKELLTEALQAQHPSVIVTTSHGKTGPLDKPNEMGRQLGLLVDADYHIIEPDDLLTAWRPNGAIWFAQACCSAGAQKPSMYRGLFDQTSDTGQVLDGVSTVGPMSAPLPKALLGCANPLRALIGHVEPTFEWTLWHPATRAQLTDWVRTLMYQELNQGAPVGLALQRSRLYTDIGALLLQHQDALAQHAVAPDKGARRTALDLALYDKVTAYDRACTVLLGDPTVAIRLP